ncbi:hypothetical protein SBY92_003602 [Candida maltosa Xu316]|uniref:Uncharacterized protein n=1 Tax=Candida maltosa (strain Xu316) TaxID=1245528 RepID=M3HRW7_CANMX|nr:hypothetical protein G210_4666 [Candida maltosa Xu316]
MENILTALAVSLISNNKRLAIVSDDSKLVIPKVITLLRETCNFEPTEYCVIDLLAVHTTIDLIHKMTIFKDNEYYLKKIIIWQNVQYLTLNQHKSLYKLILQIDQYEMTGLKNKPIEIAIGNNEVISINRPQLFTIIMPLEYSAFHRKIYVYLKEKFWFAVNYNNDVSIDCSSIPRDITFEDTLLNLRKKLPIVFVSPDIKRYMYSLIIFTRSHRLASLSPKSVRLPTMAIDYVNDFCRGLVLWQNKDKFGQDLFVTPSYVKLAFRKIGYWLVDWEYNEKFAKVTANNVDSEGIDTDLDYQKRLEISMLTGDWYGSDYFFVNEYLKHSKSKLDKETPTGYTNKIIEDVITSVRPPL